MSEWPLPEVRFSCKKCGLETTLPREQIEAVFGSDVDMFALRQGMTQSCVPTKNEVCQSRLTDALLVQAILEPDEAKVVDPSLIPQALEWRERLGMPIEATEQGA